MTAVASSEILARFILQAKHLRQDQTVRPDAFIPHPYPDLSLTRHGEMTEAALWKIGEEISDAISKRLHGRADVRTRVFERERLVVRLAPTRENPNHVNVQGWPPGKPAQKIIAQVISAAAGRAILPPISQP